MTKSAWFRRQKEGRITFAMSTSTDEVGQRVRTAREFRRLGVNELARMASISAGGLSRLERGGRSTGKRAQGVGSETIAKLSAALGVRAAWLTTGEGPMVEEADPLPNRLAAILLAREGGVPEPAIDAVLALQVPEAEGRSTWWWMKAIHLRETMLEQEGMVPPSSRAPHSLPPASSHRRPTLLVKP